MSQMESDVSRTWFVMMRQLGFDPNKIGATYKLKIQEAMFRTANPRGLEVTLHFLLTKLDPIKSRDKFKPCWPIQDKNEERQFRKLCIDWLNDLGAIWPSLGFNTSRKPSVILLNPIGDKVYRFLFNFTLHVLMAQIHTFPARYKHSIPALPQPGNEGKCDILTNGAIRASQALTIENLRQFLFWMAERHKCATSWMNTSQKYCEEIKVLRKSNRECQKRISELSNVSRKSGTKSVAHLLPTIDSISEQMVQLSDTLDTFTSYCATLENSLSFGNKQTTINGAKINLKLENPILSSYEKLYTNGRIGALYSHKNEINLGAYLQLGKLSLVTADDVIGQFKGPPLFDKWRKPLDQIGTKEKLVPVLESLKSEMTSVKLEEKEIEHHNNRINALECELRNFNESEFAHLFVPPNLTDKFDEIFAEMFKIPTLDPLGDVMPQFSDLIPPFGETATHPGGTGTQFGTNPRPSDDTMPHLGDTIPTISFIEPLNTTEQDLSSNSPLLSNLNISTNETLSTTKPELTPFIINKKFKQTTQQKHKQTNKKVPKTQQQIMEDLTDKLSTAILSENSFGIEDHFLCDPLEALDEKSAFQSKDNITRTPDSIMSLATQSPDSKSMECGASKIAFLSPLKDEDD